MFIEQGRINHYPSEDTTRLGSILKLNTQAINDLATHVQKYSIDCEWSEVGKLQGAVKQRGTGKMQKFAEALDAIGQPYRCLNRDDVKAITGTPHYAGAIHTPGCVLMNPVKLTRGLATNLPENVTLHDSSPITRFDQKGTFFSIDLSHAKALSNIRSQNVLMCTNAFTPEFGYLRSRIVPVLTFASITRPLTDAEMQTYGGQLDWGLTPADPGGTTLRMTQDRRLLIRNQYDYADRYSIKHKTLNKVRLKHRLSFNTRYPSLEHVPFTCTWGGVCALSRNHVSYFGKLANRVWGSMCHNGVGVARGTISGRLLAEAATGQNSELLSNMFSVSSTPAINPPKPLLSLGVRARLKAAAWESKEEI